MRMPSWLKRLWQLHRPDTFSDKDFETLVGDSPSVELLDELSSFGDLMFGEITNTTAALDAKASAALGWAAVPLGFIIVGSPEWTKPGSAWIVACALAITIFGLTAACFAAVAMRTRPWKVPSQRDWFRTELLGHPQKLRYYHIVSRLAAHRDGVMQNAAKSLALVRAETALIVSVVLMGVMAVGQTFYAFTDGLF